MLGRLREFSVYILKCIKLFFILSNLFQFDFNFVEVHRVKAFKFRPLRQEDLHKKQVSYQTGQDQVTLDPLQDKGSSLKPTGRVGRHNSTTSISSWNIDGELGDVPDVDVR